MFLGMKLLSELDVGKGPQARGGKCRGASDLGPKPPRKWVQLGGPRIGGGPGKPRYMLSVQVSRYHGQDEVIEACKRECIRLLLKLG